MPCGRTPLRFDAALAVDLAMGPGAEGLGVGVAAATEVDIARLVFPLGQVHLVASGIEHLELTAKNVRAIAGCLDLRFSHKCRYLRAAPDDIPSLYHKRARQGRS